MDLVVTDASRVGKCVARRVALPPYAGMDDDPKATARAAAFAARKAAHAMAETVKPDATAHLLGAIGEVAADTVIAGYMPIRTEIDPIPAMTALHAKGAVICVPEIIAASQPLVFRQWHPEADMVDGPFGAKIPANGALILPDIFIVPLVAFDAHLNRLGYGGGFYDRTLELARARRKIRAIGFAYGAQQLSDIPQEPTDQPIDLIVTEQGTLAAPRAQA